MLGVKYCSLCSVWEPRKAPAKSLASEVAVSARKNKELIKKSSVS